MCVSGTAFDLHSKTCQGSPVGRATEYNLGSHGFKSWPWS